jgi:hypothetical protein
MRGATKKRVPAMNVRLGPIEVWHEALAAARGQPRELAPRELGEFEDDQLRSVHPKLLTKA